MPIYFISIFLLLWFSFSSLITANISCNNEQIFCSKMEDKLGSRDWCCKRDKECGEIEYTCTNIFDDNQYSDVGDAINIFIFIICIFYCGFLFICYRRRKVRNTPTANVIYEPVMVTEIRIPISEEPPPSYEEVMNNNSSYQLENLR